MASLGKQHMPAGPVTVKKYIPNATEHTESYCLLLLLRLLLRSCPTYASHSDITLTRVGPLLQYGHTSLHWAARNGHLEVVQQLLGAGAAVDATDEVRQLCCNRLC
jgi:hypothetical protein